MQPKKKHHKAPPAKPKKIVEKRKMPEPSAKPEPIKIRPKKHLFLDLDETLMCGLANTNTTLPKLKTKFDFQGKKAVFNNIVKRPGLDEFLTALYPYYHLYIYTSSHQLYAEAMVDTIGIRKYVVSVIHREKCRRVKDLWIKRLKNFDFPPAQMILVDDAEVQVKRQLRQSLRIKPFFGEADDRELFKVIPFFIELAKYEDPRPVGLRYNSFLQNGRLEVDKNLLDSLPASDTDSEGDEETKNTGQESEYQRNSSVYRKPEKTERPSELKRKNSEEFEIDSDEGIPPELLLSRDLPVKSQKSIFVSTG